MATLAMRSPVGRNSPTLRAFELNPFRVLRLEVDVSTADAANRAEKALTLERVGLEPSEPDPLAWLPAAGSYELQQAAQMMEEPLVRLKHQMLWFDCVRDPAAETLRVALGDLENPALRQYLKETIKLPKLEGRQPVAKVSADLKPATASVPASPIVRCLACGASIAAVDAKCPACGVITDIIDPGGVPETALAAAVGERGGDLNYELKVSFWESVRGGEATLKVAHEERCPACGGSGNVAGQTTVCPSCRGNAEAARACMRCDGSGNMAVSCKECSGRGEIERSVETKVWIPSGIQPGMRLRLRGKGMAGKEGGLPGDLYVVIKVSAHEFFQREGNDIFLQLPLTPAEAASGGEIKVPGLDGAVCVPVPENSQAGQRVRLRGQGVPDARSRQPGDLYIEIAIPASEQRRRELRRDLDERVRQASVKTSGSPTADREAQSREARRAEWSLATPADHAVVAQAINQANLRLLLAAASLDGMAGGASSVPVEPRKIAAAQWISWNGFQKLPQAHEVLTGGVVSGGEPGDGVQGYWRAALQRWTEILESPAFGAYLEVCIADLGDDYVSADDTEAVIESMRTYLVDLSAQEARRLLLEGRYALAGSMISAMADSRMGSRVLTPAARPIRQVCQAELSELAALIEQPGGSVVESAGAYLRRLEAIRSRWARLDEKGVVGLRDLIDEGIEKAYLALRNLEKPDKTVDGLLAQAGRMVRAQSLRERLNSFQAELVELRSRMCHFCKTNKPDYDKSVVLKGMKETHREETYSSTLIHYRVQYQVVFRCPRCARQHDFIRHTGWALSLAALPGLVALLTWFLK